MNTKPLLLMLSGRAKQIIISTENHHNPLIMQLI